MTDIITWSPRKGSTGDDKYKFADTPFAMTAGIKTYSSTPTITEINSGSGFNQIIAEAKRQDLILVVTGSAPTYVNPGDKIYASPISTLQSLINNLRTKQGLSAFSFARTPSVGDTVRHQDYWELRKALPNTYAKHVPKIESNDKRFWNKTIIISTGRIQSYGYSSTERVGRSYAATPSPRYKQMRLGFTYDIPSDIPDVTSAKIYLGVSAITNEENFYLRLYRSNSIDYTLSYDGSGFPTSVTSDTDNIDNLEDSIADTSLVTDSVQSFGNGFSLNVAAINAAKGSSLSYIAATSLDVDGSGDVTKNHYVDLIATASNSMFLILSFD